MKHLHLASLLLCVYRERDLLSDFQFSVFAPNIIGKIPANLNALFAAHNMQDISGQHTPLTEFADIWDVKTQVIFVILLHIAALHLLPVILN